MSALDVYYKFNLNLVNGLPVKDPLFSARLLSTGLYSGNLKQKVKAQPTDADAATLFLDEAIERPLTNGDKEPFEKLLTVIEQFNNQQLKKLASEIRKELPGGTGSKVGSASPGNNIKRTRGNILSFQMHGVYNM